MALATALASEQIRITANGVTEPYWQATKENRLLAASCARCGRFRMPPGPFCPNCLCAEISWKEVTGTGTIYSFTVCRMPASKGNTEFTYVPALVEFAEAPGVRFAGNVVDIDTAEIYIDMPVAIEWKHTAEGWGVPIFRPLVE